MRLVPDEVLNAHPQLREQTGVIALFPCWRPVSQREFGCWQRAPFGTMLAVSRNHHSMLEEPLSGPYYTDKGLVDHHLAACGGAALGLRHPGWRLLDQCLHEELTPHQLSDLDWERLLDGSFSALIAMLLPSTKEAWHDVLSFQVAWLCPASVSTTR